MHEVKSSRYFRWAKRAPAVGVVALVLSFAVVARSALALGRNSATARLGAANHVITSCDPDGFAASYATSFRSEMHGSVVTLVRLTGVAPGCDGSMITATLLDATQTPLDETTATLSVTDGRAAVAMTGTVLMQEVARTYVVVSG